MRLSFCYPEPADIRLGVQRLSEVITRDLELVRIFGPISSRNGDADAVVGPAPDQI